MKSYFMIGLSIIAILADVVTLFQFIVSNNYLKFFSTQWLLTVALIIALIIFSCILFFIGSNGDSPNLILSLFSLLYYFISLLLIFYWGIIQIYSCLPLSDFFGFFILFLVTSSIVVLCTILRYKDFDSGEYATFCTSLKYLSYGYGISLTTYTMSWIDKYIFSGSFIMNFLYTNHYDLFFKYKRRRLDIADNFDAFFNFNVLAGELFIFSVLTALFIGVYLLSKNDRLCT